MGHPAVAQQEGAWAYVVDQEMEGLVDDMAFRRNVMGWLAGAGILALVSGAHAATTTLTVKNPGNVTGTVPNRYLQGDSTSGMYDRHPRQRHAGGQGDGDDHRVQRERRRRHARHGDHRGDGDYVVSAQTPTGNSYNKEPEGILAGIDDGTYVATYHNISRTTYPLMKSYVVTGVGPLSLDALQQPIDVISIKSGSKNGVASTRSAASTPCAAPTWRSSSPIAATPARTSRARTAAPRGEEADRQDHHLRRHPVPRRPRRAVRDALRHQQGLVGALRRARRRVGEQRGLGAEVEQRVRRIHRVLPHLRELPLPQTRAELPHGRHHGQPDRGSQLLSRGR
jgi:hypothetical protein